MKRLRLVQVRRKEQEGRSNVCRTGQNGDICLSSRKKKKQRVRHFFAQKHAIARTGQDQEESREAVGPSFPPLLPYRLGQDSGSTAHSKQKG